MKPIKWVAYIVCALFTALLIASLSVVLPTVSSFTGSPKAYYIPSGSMMPTLQINDRILVDQGAYASQPPHRGDIVVFRPPQELRSKGMNSVLVARVIGLPKEQVAVRGGTVLINGQPIAEPYIAEPPSYQHEPVVIPENAYFVLGDNRNNSYDSHYWGFVPHADLAGKVHLIYWPFNRYGSLYKKS